MSTFCHAPLKIALLLHKMANGPYSLSETVCRKSIELKEKTLCVPITKKALRRTKDGSASKLKKTKEFQD